MTILGGIHQRLGLYIPDIVVGQVGRTNQDDRNLAAPKSGFYLYNLVTPGADHASVPKLKTVIPTSEGLKLGFYRFTRPLRSVFLIRREGYKYQIFVGCHPTAPLLLRWFR
jgi:hypothetical protein